MSGGDLFKVFSRSEHVEERGKCSEEHSAHKRPDNNDDGAAAPSQVGEKKGELQYV